MAFAQTLDAEGVSNEFVLHPGETVNYLADTSDLDEATLRLEQSNDYGGTWQQARDREGVLVADVVGSGGAESSAAVLKNEGASPIRYRASLIETGTLAGEIAVTFDAPVVAAVNPGQTYVLTEYADNAAALSGGLVAGDWFILAATQAVTRVEAA